MKNLLLCALLFATVGFAKTPTVHGMLLFGKKATYISHLPMFHAPHDYQMISEVELKDTEAGALAKYEKAKLQADVFTLVPEPFEMSDLLAGTTKTFQASIYQGHFERGGKDLGLVTVSMKTMVLGEKISKEIPPSADFLAFGHDGEYFLAHVIKGQPTYDGIYAISQPYKLIVPACGRGSCDMPYVLPLADTLLPKVVKADQKFAGVHPTNTELGIIRSTQVGVLEPLYVEYGDLAH